MGKHSPSARKHRALKFLGHLWQYETYGPLIGPKEAHQPDNRGTKARAQTSPHPDCTARYYVHGPHTFISGIDNDGLIWADCPGWTT